MILAEDTLHGQNRSRPKEHSGEGSEHAELLARATSRLQVKLNENEWSFWQSKLWGFGMADLASQLKRIRNGWADVKKAITPGSVTQALAQSSCAEIVAIIARERNV